MYPPPALAVHDLSPDVVGATGCRDAMDGGAGYGQELPLKTLEDGEEEEAAAGLPRAPSGGEAGGRGGGGGAAPEEALQSTACRAFILVCVWWSSAVFVALLIARCVGRGAPGGGGYPFPFALSSMTNTATGGLQFVLGRALRRRGAPLPRLRRDEVCQLSVIGLLQGVSIGTTNKALEYMALSLRTMVASTGVLFMMLTAWLWDLERLGCLRGVAALLLTLAGVLQGLGQGAGAPAGSLIGIGLQVLSMTLSAQQWALTQFVTQRSPADSALGQMTKVELSAWILPVTGVVCLSLAAVFEPYALSPGNFLRADVLGTVLGVTAGLAALTCAELSLVHLTSAVALQVLSTLHQIPIILGGVLLFNERVRLVNAVGFGFSVAGALVYVAARRDDQRRLLGEAPGRLDEVELYDVHDAGGDLPLGRRGASS